MRASVDELKNSIKAMNKDLANLSPGRLKLYKIPIDDEYELQEILGGLGSGRLLLGHHFLGKIR